MRAILVVIILSFCTIAPFVQGASLEEIYAATSTADLNVYETNLSEFVQGCCEKIPDTPAVVDMAVKKYANAVKYEYNKCRQYTEKKLVKLPELKVKFKQMVSTFDDFTSLYASVSVDFEMADFKSGNIPYGNAYKHGPTIMKLRGQMKMLHLFRRFLDTENGTEMQLLFGAGPVGGPRSKESKLFKKLHR